MIKEALEYLMGFKDTEITDHNGFKYTNSHLIQMPEDSPNVFSTKTLASLVELILKENAHGSLNDLIIHVESPTKVNVHTALRSHLDRFNLYSAVAELPQITLGNYMEIEKFNIMLKSTFVQSDMRDNLIALVGSITEEAVKTTNDDGISQKVVARKGINTVGNVTIQPIVKLAPYRTFLEVAQPEGEFLLRLKDGPEAALFEADGGAWKIEARLNIKEYFVTHLAELITSGKVIVTE